MSPTSSSEAVALYLLQGRLAQLGERCVRNAEVGGSIPPSSTNQPSKLRVPMAVRIHPDFQHIQDNNQVSSEDGQAQRRGPVNNFVDLPRQV